MHSERKRGLRDRDSPDYLVQFEVADEEKITFFYETDIKSKIVIYKNALTLIKLIYFIKD
jgi:hypothetical protein